MYLFSKSWTIRGVLFIIIVFLSCYAGYLYFEKPLSTRKIKTEALFTANEILEKATRNDSKELREYIEKAIEVKGVIREITYRQGIYTLILQGSQNQTFIICEMQLEEGTRVQNLKVGELVSIKGVYKGMLKDVILLNCLVV